MYKSNLFRYHSSSEEESEQDEHISPAFIKSAVFNPTQPPHMSPCNVQNRQEQDFNELQQQESHLKPKLKVQNDILGGLQSKDVKCMENFSTVNTVTTNKKHSSSQANINKKMLNAAYTFKLKSPNPSKKKHDPVSLFQKNSTGWKKDKFLGSRTDFKEGRKLQLQKRNKLYQ